MRRDRDRGVTGAAEDGGGVDPRADGTAPGLGAGCAMDFDGAPGWPPDPFLLAWNRNNSNSS